MIATAGTSELFDFGGSGRNNRGIVVIVSKLVRVNESLIVELNRDVSIELKIVSLLIIRAFFPTDRLWRFVRGCRIDNDIHIFQNVLVVFEPQIRFRMYGK